MVDRALVDGASCFNQEPIEIHRSGRRMMGEIAERGFQKRLGWTQKLMIRIEQAEASLERRNRSISKMKERKRKIQIPKA